MIEFLGFVAFFGAIFFIVLFIITIEQGFDKYIVIILLVVIFFTAFSLAVIMEGGSEKYNITTHLEPCDTIFPMYDFERKKYILLYDEKIIENLSSIPAYTSDSSLIESGVLVYEKIKPKIFGLISKKEKEKYVFSAKETIDIKKALKIKTSVKLKK